MYLPIFIIFRKIFQKKRSYSLKIDMKNSKIDRRTKPYLCYMEKILKDDQKKKKLFYGHYEYFLLIFFRLVNFSYELPSM